MVRIRALGVLTTHQPLDELVELRVAERDVRRAERRHDLDTRGFEIGSREHDDDSEPHQPGLTQGIDLFLRRCVERRDAVATLFREALAEPCRVAGEQLGIEFVASHHIDAAVRDRGQPNPRGQLARTHDA